MKPRIQLRPAREQDLIPAFTMVMTSLNHLRRQHSMKPIKFQFKELPPIPRHLFHTDAVSTFCAWKANRIVGFAQALNRGKQWYLAYLFVDPTVQDKGIGRALLEKVWRDGTDVSHALCTFSYNMQAVGIYSQFGMAPLMTLPWMGITKDRLKRPKPTGLKASKRLTEADIDWIVRLEGEVRGYARPQEWRFWTSDRNFAPFIFRDKGKRVAYGVLYKEMGIGPIGAISNQYTVKAAAELIRRANPPKSESISTWVPTHNLALYRMYIEAGFRCEEIAVFMADQPYPDFQRYVPTHLAVF